MRIDQKIKKDIETASRTFEKFPKNIQWEMIRLLNEQSIYEVLLELPDNYYSAFFISKDWMQNQTRMTSLRRIQAVIFHLFTNQGEYKSEKDEIEVPKLISFTFIKISSDYINRHRKHFEEEFPEIIF